MKRIRSIVIGLTVAGLLTAGALAAAPALAASAADKPAAAASSGAQAAEKAPRGVLPYDITVTVAAPFSETVPKVRAALAAQGFGVLTEIDVQATLQARLGVQFEPYLILGACNAPLAYQALEVDRNIGLLLPCNVVVRAKTADTTLVQAEDPRLLSRMTGNAALRPIAEEAYLRLTAALNAVAG